MDLKQMINELSYLKTKADVAQGQRSALEKDLQPKMEELKQRLPMASDDLRTLVERFFNNEPESSVQLAEYVAVRIKEMQNA